MDITLGKRIAENRKRLGLTQDALAEKLGITAQAVSKWENDLSCPDITMLPKLSEIFGISTDELLGREAPPPVHTAEVVEDAEADGVHVHNGNWEFHWDSGRKSGLCSAICVLLVGVLYLLSKWFQWDVSFWAILWPSVLLVFGLAGMLSKFSVFHLGLALFGGYSLVHNLGIWQLDIAGDLIFPICVVLFGVGLLIDALRKPKKPNFRIVHKGENSQKTKNYCVTHNNRFSCDLSFGETAYCVKTDCLEGGEADVSFGDLTVDLTECAQVAQYCHIDADCAFGHLELRIPRRFRVEQNASPAFGSVNVQGQPDDDPIGIINLEADASFGEISIRYV